jgi:hypothetical protein
MCASAQSGGANEQILRQRADFGAFNRRTTMYSSSTKRIGLAACALAVASIALAAGCTPKTGSTAAASINDKVYTVTPDAVKVTAGIVTGEITEMKVIERVEEGSGRVAEPARLTGKLALKNVSTDQTVRLIAGRLLYIDAQGRPIKLEDNRGEPTLKMPSAYSASERLDPGQDATQPVDAEFPVAALKAKKLKEIRLELSYIPSAFRQEKLNFNVSIAQSTKAAATASQ